MAIVRLENLRVPPMVFLILPPKGWRTIVGSELKEMNSDAEVGLVESVSGLYLVVIPERLNGINKAAFTKDYFKDLLTDHEEDSYAKNSVCHSPMRPCLLFDLVLPMKIRLNTFIVFTGMEIQPKNYCLVCARES